MPARSASAGALGRAVRELRLERGLTQEGLALRSTVGRGFFGKVERGESNATFETILKVSAALGVPASEVVARAERFLSE